MSSFGLKDGLNSTYGLRPGNRHSARRATNGEIFLWIRRAQSFGRRIHGNVSMEPEPPPDGERGGRPWAGVRCSRVVSDRLSGLLACRP